MTPEERNRARILAAGANQFGNIGFGPHPTSPSFRNPPAPSVMDVLAKQNSPIAIPKDTSGRSDLTKALGTKGYTGRGNIQTQQGEGIRNLINQGNALNKSWNQALFGRDTLFDYPAIEKGIADSLRKIKKDYQEGYGSRNYGDNEPEQVPVANNVNSTGITIPSAINDMSSYNEFAQKQQNNANGYQFGANGENPDYLYLPNGKGKIKKLSGGNVGGISNQEVLDRLIARRNAKQDALIEERNRNPFVSRQRTEEDNAGGVDAADAVKALNTKSVHTGRKDIFGNEIMETPRSVRINSPLDLNYSKDSAMARKYDENIASGMSREDAYSDVINEGRTIEDRKMRLDERNAKNSNAIDTRRLDIDQQKANTDEIIAQANKEFKGEQAKLYPAQAEYYKAYAKQLKGKNSAGIKAAMNNSFFKALAEIGKLPEGPDKEMALERLYAARAGKKLTIKSPAVEGKPAGWFTGYVPAKPAETILEDFPK